MSQAPMRTVTEPIVGQWTTLEAITPANLAEVERVDRLQALLPQMAGGSTLRASGPGFIPSMAIRDNRSRQIIGLLENHEMVGYPGVAVLLVFVDTVVTRPGVAMEACMMYVPRLFLGGAELVHGEVLSFNRDMLPLMSKRFPVQARLRRHMYAAGHFWDVLVFSWDASEWRQIFGKWDRVLPGGRHPISALGATRKRDNG